MPMRHILQFFLVLSLPLFAGFTYTDSSPDILDSACDGCPKPKQIKLDMVTDTSALLTWQQSDTVTSVTIRVIRVSDTTDTDVVLDAVSPWLIDGLMKCELYRVEIMSFCGDSLSDFTDPVIFETDGCCRIPSGFQSSLVSDTFATFIWDDVIQADSFAVRYKLTDQKEEDAWIRVFTSETSLTLEDLDSCSAYDVQLKSLCHQESTEYSASYLLQTLGCGVCTSLEYCVTGGIDATSSWIDSIAFANFSMKSGSNDGYFAYTTEQTALERGRTYDFFVVPGFAGGTCREYIRVWMDLDQDGSFNDSTELLLDTVDLSGLGVGSSVRFDDALPRGITRLRIAMKPMTESDTIPPDACGVFNFGEVEDYCIRIDEPCPPAENVDTVFVTTTSATFTWDSDTTAFGYIYSVNIAGEPGGEPMITGDTMVELTGLEECTEYEFKIISVCDQETDSLIFEFKTRCETAVEDLAPLVRNMKIFPNPFSSQFHLELEAVEALQGYIQLSSITGQILHSEQLDVFAGERIVRDFDALQEAAPGIYILVIQTDNKLLARKLIKSDN
jgi:GEVED domain